MTATDYNTKCTIIFEANNGDLKDYPAVEKVTFEFDATDASIDLWVLQFKRVLAVAGYADKTINDYLGDV
jgi:hypothetical protein